MSLWLLLLLRICYFHRTDFSVNFAQRPDPYLLVRLSWTGDFSVGFLLEKLSISTLFHYFDMPSYYIFLLHMYSLVCMNIHSQFNFAFLLAHLSENSVYMSSNQFLKGTHDRYMWVSSIWVHFIIENMICTFLHSQIQELVMYSCFWLQIETN
jgi:hypothetical protein